MRRSIGTVLASLAALAACGDGSVTFEVIVAAVVESEAPPIDCYRLQASWSGGVRSDAARDLEELAMLDLEPGTYEFVLEAVHRPIRPARCEEGDVVGRARASGASIAAGRSTRVPLVLVPMNRLASLKAPDWVHDWLEDRSDLGVASATDLAGTPYVLFSGGRFPDGTISDDLLVYEPRAYRFSRLEHGMACARAGHAAVTVRSAGAPASVLLAGGEGRCNDGEAAAAKTAEVWQPGERFASPASAPLVALPRPIATSTADGSVLVMGSGPVSPGRARPVLQRFDGEAWVEVLQDPRIPVSGGSISPAFPDGLGPYVIVGGRRDDGSLLEGLALVQRTSRGFEACTLDGDDLPIRGDEVLVTPIHNGEVLITGIADDSGGMAWSRVSVDVDCASLGRVTFGGLSVARPRPVSAALSDGRILLTGSDPAGTAEVFLPSVGTTLALETSSVLPRTGHVATTLPDGSVLLAGGGPRELQIFLPRDVSSDRFHWDEHAEPEPNADLLLVVSNSAEASEVRAVLGSGGTLDELGSLVPAGPAGIIAAIAPLNVASDSEFFNPRIRIAVTTGDMRCEGRSQPPASHTTVACGEQSPDDALECVLDQSSAAQGCVAQELFRAAVAAAEAFPPLPDRSQTPLLVLIAGARDDCSTDGSDLFESTDGELTRRCAEATDLFVPEEVIDSLDSTRPGLVSVLTLGGPDRPAVLPDGSLAPPACGNIRPTPRLAALAAGRASRVHHVDLCQPSSLHPPLQWWSDLVDARIGSRVCLPYATQGLDTPSGGVLHPATCVLAFDRELGEGQHEAVRLDYRFIPASTSRPQVDDCADGLLERIDPEDPDGVPLGRKVAYACQ